MVQRASERKTQDFFANAILFAVAIVSWVYAIKAGAIVSKRYLESIDLSQFHQDERVPNFLEEFE